MADLHLGGWRDPKIRELSIKTFKEAVKICIKENVGFVLISGDLFDTALPSIDLLKIVAASLNELKKKNIAVYCIAGSHDFSPSGKTMLDVLEEAGLLKNVFRLEDRKLKFIIDKTGAKITGLLGKKGGLESLEYSELEKENLEKENGFKIFMFHTALEEFKPKELEKVEGLKLRNLPKNFSYYAGGHVHYIFNKFEEDYGLIVFPGALFPNNFAELEKFKHGGFYIIDDKLNLNYKNIKFHEVEILEFFADGKSSEDLEREILEKVLNVEDKIVMLRISGVLESGKQSDLNFKKINKAFEDNKAYCILRNTSKLTSKEFKEFEVESGSVEEIEEKVVKEHLGQIKIFEDEERLTFSLMKVLSKEKDEGVRNIDFENGLLKEVIKVLNLEEKWEG